MILYGLWQQDREDENGTSGSYIEFFSKREDAKEAINALQYYQKFFDYYIHDIKGVASLADPELHGQIKIANDCYQDHLKYSV